MPTGAGLTVILQSKALDRAHYALMLAASNAALDRPTTLFFAIEGVEIAADRPWERYSTQAGEAGGQFLQRLEAGHVAHPIDLLEALSGLEARLAICDSGLAVAGLSSDDLRPGVAYEVTGLTDILAARDHRIVYV